MRILLILLIVFYSTKTFPIEIYKLISENDLAIFLKIIKKWNETIVFLDKKNHYQNLMDQMILIFKILF